jgi:putative membrane protein
MTNGPVLIDLEERPDAPTPATAPPVPDAGDPGQAMRRVATLSARRPSRLARLFWAALGALLTAWLSVAAWDFAAGMLARNLWLGRAAVALIALVLVAGLGMALKEWLALARLGRVDRLRAGFDRLDGGALIEARAAVDRLRAFYRGRADVDWALANLEDRAGGVFDADALVALAEREVMGPLDRLAVAEVEAAARQVATVTAIVPLALADVVTALVANLRMIRRIAEIYGGRAGLFGSWRLFRGVMVHLVATGAVAVGDDMIQSVAGGGLLSKLSRRFGEGVVNGALTARVGIAAMEVCRPMPFRAVPRPGVSGVVGRALKGLFRRG